MRRLARGGALLVLLAVLLAHGALESACGGSESDGSNAIPLGAYACTASDLGVVTANGIDYHSSGGGSGTLVLSGGDPSLSASYTDMITAATSTVAFTKSSGDSANVAGGQTFAGACASSLTTGSTDVVVSSVSGGSLTYDGSTLFVELLGSIASGDCAGQQSDLSLVCTAD